MAQWTTRDGIPFKGTDDNESVIAAAGAKDVQNGHKLPPPPDNLHDICSDWITEAGRKKCKREYDVELCCALPASDRRSCWEDQVGECVTYGLACMALELHSDGGDDGLMGDDDAHTVGGADGDGPVPLPS